MNLIAYMDIVLYLEASLHPLHVIYITWCWTYRTEYDASILKFRV